MRNEPMRRNDLPETCFSILPSSGQLIIIRCGERGYYPSEWDTGNREENREIASSHNVRRGITDNSAYHICEFAEMQERNGNTYVPRTPKISAEIGTYEIYQIPAIADVDYCFRPYAEAREKLQIADYQRSYAGMLAKENSLEHLWAKHNSDHRPFARRMRSLSVSDVVVLTQAGKKTAYYADTFGFQDVPEFLAQQRVQKKHRERGEAR